MLEAKSAVNRIPSKYNNSDFFEMKENITYTMAMEVNNEFRKNFAEVIALIITDIQLDSSFETQLEKQQITKRTGETALKQQEIDKLEGQIEVVRSQYDAKVRDIQAQAKRKSDVIKETATSKGVSLQIDAMRKAYRKMETSGLGVGAAEVIEYHFYRRLRRDTSKNLNVYVSPDATVSLSAA